jgi:phenylpropionate dioxygenase-like ring-hydroxylating dioxygenase large terminal subunit
MRGNYLVYKVKSMQRATHERLIEQLRAHPPAAAAAPAFRVPAEHYLAEARCDRERAVVFGGVRAGVWHGPPRVIAASAALEPGGCLPIDVPGASLILTRGGDGVARGLANACRHRATRLVDAPCAARALVCPYHGWTYDLTGALIHVPHAGAFSPADRRDLPVLPVAERHGLIWLGADAAGVAGQLGELDGDLAALELDRHAVWRTRRETRRCNWKLIVEAFLDAYHIRTLHRDSIYRFFLDAASTLETVGPHVRAITARRALRDAPGALPDDADLRALGTPSYVVFPATVIIVHPDFVSVILLHPLSADRTDYAHVMLVPADRRGETGHWDKSWALIEDTVFQREDLWVCEQIQRGLAAGTTDALVFGELESAVRGFHAAIDRALEAPVG